MQQTTERLVTVGIKARIGTSASSSITIPANSWYVTNIPIQQNIYTGYKTESGLISTYSDIVNGDNVETHYIGNAQILIPKA